MDDTQKLAYIRGPGHFTNPDAFTLAPVPTPPPHRPTEPSTAYKVLRALLVVQVFVCILVAIAAMVDGSVGMALTYTALAGLGAFLAAPSKHSPWMVERAALAARADAENHAFLTHLGPEAPTAPTPRHDPSPEPATQRPVTTRRVYHPRDEGQAFAAKIRERVNNAAKNVVVSATQFGIERNENLREDLRDAKRISQYEERVHMLRSREEYASYMHTHHASTTHTSTHGIIKHTYWEGSKIPWHVFEQLRHNAQSQEDRRHNVDVIRAWREGRP